MKKFFLQRRMLLASLFLLPCASLAGLNVKGFSLSEGSKIKEIYGSCHRLEEPLVIKIYASVNFVASNNGWEIQIKTKMNEEKKYVTQYFSSDNKKMTAAPDGDIYIGQDKESIVQGPTPRGFDYLNGYRTDYLYPSTTGNGKHIYYITLPSRNISYLSIEFKSGSNNNGSKFVWDERDGNYLRGAWLGSSPKNIVYEGFDDSRLSLNLLNLDHLFVKFEQADPARLVPFWEMQAGKMEFRDAGGYSKTQYEAACK